MKGIKFLLKLCLVCYIIRNGFFYFISLLKVNVLKFSGFFELYYVYYLFIVCFFCVEIGGGRDGC